MQFCKHQAAGTTSTHLTISKDLKESPKPIEIYLSELGQLIPNQIALFVG